MKFFAGFFVGIFLSGLVLFLGGTYYFTDYLIQEKITVSSELDSSLKALEQLQEKIAKFPERERVDLCSNLCANSNYQFTEGRKTVRKIEVLQNYLQVHGKKAFRDPEFLLDLHYVQGSVTPIHTSGIFQFLKTMPSSVLLWRDKAWASSSLALISPRILFAMRDASGNYKRLKELRELRRSCESRPQSEVLKLCKGQD